MADNDLILTSLFIIYGIQISKSSDDFVIFCNLISDNVCIL